jgi:hypothetical protein
VPTKRLGVIGTMVWDTIHQRDPTTPVIEEWVASPLRSPRSMRTWATNG